MVYSQEKRLVEGLGKRISEAPLYLELQRQNQLLSTFLSLPEKQGILGHIAIIAGIWPSIGRILSPALLKKETR